MSGVQSIERAFALLRALAIEPAGVTDLADRTDLPKSTVSRLLATLVSEGAVEQLEEGGEYRLGGELLELAQSTSPDRSLIATARPFLTELASRTGETSGLSVLNGDEVRYLDNVLSEEEVTVRDWTGEATPLHVTPSGIVLLAGLDHGAIERYLGGPLTRNTANTLTDPAQITERIDLLRRVGHVWAYGEFDEGLNSVAAPVVDTRGNTVAALHVHGPAYRFPGPGAAEELGQLLRDTAAQLSARVT